MLVRALKSLIILAFLNLAGCSYNDSGEPPQALQANESVPYCENPIGVIGEYDPTAPGYFIIIYAINENADVNAEANVLKDKYGLQVGSVTESNQYSAQFFVGMSDDTLERVRCHDTPDTTLYIERNQTIYLDDGMEDYN